jgi:hypothetical protein
LHLKVFEQSATNVIVQLFETIITGLNGRGGLFSESRKILPHSMERQLGPEILPSTAPEDGRLREGSLPCLHHAPDHGLGGVRQAEKILPAWRVNVAAL